MRLLIADDHALVRDALKSHLERSDPSMRVYTASSVGEAIDTLDEVGDVDLIVLDLWMPGMDGLCGLERMRQRCADKCPVAVISGIAGHHDMQAALDAGAAGFLPKTLDGTTLLAALRSMAKGVVFTPETLVPSGKGAGGKGEAGHLGMMPLLTRKESEVLGHLLNGGSNKEIARLMDVQEVTIKLHLKNICRKLQARNRTHAALRAIEIGFSSAK